MACSRTCAEVIDAEATCVVLSFLERDLSVRLEIALIGDYYDGQGRSQLAAQFLDPGTHFLE